jgi:maltose-binding protein MalE
MSKQLFGYFILLMIVLLAGCNETTSPVSFLKRNDNLQGHILVWHTWEGRESEVLSELLNAFVEINPDVKIVQQNFPSADDTAEEFVNQAASGLGPDIIIVPSVMARDLAELGVIQSLDIEKDEIDIDAYLPAAVNGLYLEDNLYGLPFSLHTFALYYNKDMLGDVNPPATIDELWQQAQEGKTFALPTNFKGAFWGVQAFGGRLFDEEGNVVLNQGGFANWLIWLKNAQAIPYLLFNKNQDDLTRLFIEGKAAYYVGHSSELSTLQNALGEEVVGVAPLPRGQNNFAGPFMDTESLLFSRASSANSHKLAMRLAKFLTNVEQQRRLALDAGKIPVNRDVQIDRRVSPIVNAFVVQSNNAVPMSLSELPKIMDAQAFGDEIYIQVLSGEIGVGEAANLLTEKINTAHGLESTRFATEVECKPGEIEVWHSWDEAGSKVLNEINQQFMEMCPETTVTLVQKMAPEELISSYKDALRDGKAPDLLINATDGEFVSLIQQDLVQSIDDWVRPEFRQRYLPAVQQTMVYENKLYGIPISMKLMALYYNFNKVSDPPGIIEDLLTQITSETRFAMPIGFYRAYWGISGFGESSDSPILDSNNRLIVGEVGLREWLGWLKTAREDSGMVLRDNQEELREMFINNEVAYLVDESEAVTELETKMGAENIGVAPLPSGRSLLDVDAVMFNSQLEPQEIAIALEFAKHLTSIRSQISLLGANKVPANVNVNVANYPRIAGFIRQAQVAIASPNVPETDVVWQWGNVVYKQVLDLDLDIDQAIDQLTHLVNSINNHLTQEEQAKHVNLLSSCTEVGEVLLWHSWTGVEVEKLQAIIATFNESCPDIQIKTAYIPAENVLNQLKDAAESSQSITETLAMAKYLTDTTVITTTRGLVIPITSTLTITETENFTDVALYFLTRYTKPDFLLTSHELIRPLREAELIQRITPFLEKFPLVDYLPPAVEAVRYKNEVYGLPQSFNMAALYYNTDKVSSPPTSFESLLEMTNESIPGISAGTAPISSSIIKPLAIDISLQGGFWGASAFGCRPCQIGKLFDDGGRQLVQPTDFAEWKNWLEETRNKPEVILSNDSAKLREMFIADEITFLVTNIDALNSFQATLGPANVGIVPLPYGPAGPSMPFLSVNVFVFDQQANEFQTELAMKFAQFFNSEQNQTLLTQGSNFLPTNNLSIAKNRGQTTSSLMEQIIWDEVVLSPDIVQLETLKGMENIYSSIPPTEIDNSEGVQ